MPHGAAGPRLALPCPAFGGGTEHFWLRPSSVSFASSFSEYQECNLCFFFFKKKLSCGDQINGIRELDAHLFPLARNSIGKSSFCRHSLCSVQFMDGLGSNIQAEVNLALSPKASMSNGSGNFCLSFLLRNNGYSSRCRLPIDGLECSKYFFGFPSQQMRKFPYCSFLRIMKVSINILKYLLEVYF